jgi:hypothetical protein
MVVILHHGVCPGHDSLFPRLIGVSQNDRRRRALNDREGVSLVTNRAMIGERVPYNDTRLSPIYLNKIKTSLHWPVRI